MGNILFFVFNIIILDLLAIAIWNWYTMYYKPLIRLRDAIKDIDFTKHSIDLTKLESLEPHGSKLTYALIKKFKELADIICLRIDNINNITDLAEHDKLTGCYNRAKLEKNKYKYTQRNTFTVIFIDVNNLKKMNDINGHEAGDSLLKTAADKLRFWEDVGDVYRLGGDEFLIVVSDETPANINKMLSVWYPNVGVLNRSSDSFKCVLSYGVAHGKNGDDFDTIMDSADVKMYEMKKAIKKRFNEAMR